MQTSKFSRYAIIAASLLGCVSVQAANEASVSQSAGSSDTAATGLLLGKLTGDTPMDRAWSAATLYKNNSNPILEEFDLTGRAQFDYFNVNSNKGSTDFFEARRIRVGVDTFLMDRVLELKATVDTNLLSYKSPSIFYNRMTDMNLTLHFDKAFNLRVGKFEPHFGYEREFSDTSQIFFERSFFDDQIFNKTGNDYLSGASANGKIGKWGYQAAAFSTNVDKEFGRFNGGQSYLGEISYDFSKDMNAEKALWAFDLMHMENERDPQSNVFNTMKNAAATYFDYHNGKYGMVTQLGYGNGIVKKGDIYELMFMPSYLITDQLELVARYQLGLAEKDNGITILNRQEKTVGQSSGNLDNAIYLGVNYYIHGQQLKLMAGEQYEDLSGGNGPTAGYRGFTTQFGLRMSF
jgi:phosphate-selective porin OprO/OprP